MTREMALPGPEFGPFLYATVGEELNGMMLSVLSTLARRDLDPWREAAELAALPVELAKNRLATMMAALPGMAPRFDVGTTADRLMVLLPKRTSADVLKIATPLENIGLNKSSLISWIVTVSLILGVQVLAASRQPRGQVAQAPASTASTVLEPRPPVESK